MEKIVKNLSKILLIISLLLLPFFGIGILFGLAGSTSKYFLLIALGYFGIIISSIICIFRYKFFPAIIISIILIITGVTLNDTFWEEHNNQLCEELRANPTCVEDECGFDCSDFPLGSGGGFFTGSEICKDKDVTLCFEKREQSIQSEKIEQNALTAFSNIVDIIIESPSPENENFENELVAIYNCLEIEYGPGTKGELMAVQILSQKDLDQEEMNKYYSYLASKGRNVNNERIVAALPNGPKSLSCEDINY